MTSEPDKSRDEILRAVFAGRTSMAGSFRLQSHPDKPAEPNAKLDNILSEKILKALEPGKGENTPEYKIACGKAALKVSATFIGALVADEHTPQSMATQAAKIYKKFRHVLVEYMTEEADRVKKDLEDPASENAGE